MATEPTDDFKPLDMKDGRIPCPRCGDKMDLKITGLCNVWECPGCGREWDEWERGTSLATAMRDFAWEGGR